MKIISTRITAIVIAALLALPFASLGVAAEADDAYHVNVGDLLQVAVYGEEQLSGKFRVDTQGAINYPLLGSVIVANLTTAEISRRLRAPASAPPTVEVVEYASVFIVGDVEKPGAYQFRPGMVAFELFALAGGSKRATEVTESPMLGLIAAEQELGELRTLRFAQTAEKARIIAETNGQDFDSSLIVEDELITPTMRQRIVANERAVFEVRRDTLISQRKALEAQRGGYEQEIASLRETIGLHDQEVDLMLQEIEGQEKLLKKGLTAQSRVLGLKREFSAVRRNALDFRLALARARQRQLEIDQRLQDLKDTRAQENAKALRQLDLDAARTAQRIASTTLRLGELRANVEHPSQSVLAYSVTRIGRGRHVTTRIGEFDPVYPRDIVRVNRAEALPGDLSDTTH